MFMVLSFLDYVAAHEHFFTFLGYRITVSILLVGIYLLMNRLKSIFWLYAFAYAAVALSATTIELMILAFGGHRSPYYVGMILLAICAVALIPARPRFHLGSLLLIYAIYAIPILATDRITDFPAFFMANSFMITCFSAAFVPSFFIAKHLRRNYGLQYDLDTERRRSERQLSENLPGIVYRLNLIGNKSMQFFNDMIEPITGYKEDELDKGAVCYIDSLIVPDDHAKVVRIVKKAVADVKPFEVEYRIMHKDGSIRHCLERGRPVSGTDGRVAHIDGIILDTTDRKRAEESLRESEERYRQLFESESDAIMLFDAETLRIEDANLSTLELLGYTKEEFLSLTPIDISAEKESTRQNMAKLMEADFNGMRVSHRKFVKKDGTSFYGDISVATFHSMGRKKVIGAIRDVTERVRAEEEKKELEHMYHQAQKLEALGELSGGISHDFNNILAIILNNLELARMQGLQSVSGYLDKALDAVKRGKGLVGNLLNFSRGMVVEPEAINLGEITDGTVNFMKKASGSHVKVKMSITPGLWNVYGNPSQLQQVVMNLYQNAREATRELAGGGDPCIDFTLENVVATRSQSGGLFSAEEEEFVRLKVTDNGRGMDKDTQARIFEPFFSTKDAASRGVGLSAVYGIVKRNGGWIDVESAPGAGTAFSVYFPRYTGEGVAREPLVSERVTGGSETVLVVDDERSLADSTGEMLETLGYSIKMAYSGEEALKILKENPGGIDLVIMDMVMPGISGVELLYDIRQIAPEARIIVASGNLDSNTSKIISDVAHLPKPYSLEALSSIVRKTLGAESGPKGVKRHMQRVKLYSVQEDTIPHNENIDSAKTIYKLFKHIAYESREQFIAVFLDSKQRIIAYDELTQGTFNEVVVHSQEVMRSALLTNAAGIILVHNHPSGDVEPSAHDIELTSRMVDSCKMFNIEFLDHIIIGKDGYFSFSKEESSRP
jgi:PAS domain S-box-containing protein